ncbi:MAG: sensor domain-containing diguanylate cyclase, partial [Candidatus Eremiobacteraeota bacterium]|nr:sensor domain-containing diguanylate cyclase [Candidatus Eremiobacteraeota bacterium]
MSARSQQGYSDWLERQGTVTVLIYSGLIIVLLPAFHFVLRGMSALPDSLELRLSGAACALCVALAIVLVPPLRRYPSQLQLFNIIPTLIIDLILVVNSGNSELYVCAGLLVVLGIQQAFFRIRDLILALCIGLVFQLGYSWHLGLLHDPLNTTVILIFFSAYLIAFFPAMVTIRTRERALGLRFEAEAARAEVATQLVRQTVITQIVESIRSTFVLQDVLDNVALALGPQLGGDRLCIALWDEGAEAMVVRSEFRRDVLLTPSILQTELKSRRWSAYYRRLLAGQTLHIADVGQSELTPSQRSFMSIAGTQEFMIAPIVARNRRRLLGFIALGRTSQSNQLTAEDRTLLESTASHIAIAIQQSRVYEQLQEELDYRKRQEARLSDLANRDALTGIFNRRYFMEEVKSCVASCNTNKARGALFFLDLDHFKIVNDTLGHDAGDRVLMAIPKVMATA